MLFRVLTVALFVLLPLLSACSKGDVKQEATKQETVQPSRQETRKPESTPQATQEARKPDAIATRTSTSAPTARLTSTPTARPTPTSVPTPTASALSVKISPESFTVFPRTGYNDIHFTATVTGAPRATVAWSIQEPVSRGGLVNVRDDFTLHEAYFDTPETPGVYHVVAIATNTDNNQVKATAVATVNVDAGVWALASRQAKPFRDPEKAPFPRLEATISAGTGSSTITYGGRIPNTNPASTQPQPTLTNKWGCTWTEPPDQIKPGDKVNGTVGVEGTVSVTNPPYNGYKWDSGFYGDVAFYAPYGGLDFTGGLGPAGNPYARIATQGASVTLPWSWTQSSKSSFEMTPHNRPSKGSKFTFQISCTTSGGLSGYSSLGTQVDYTYEARLSRDQAVQTPSKPGIKIEFTYPVGQSSKIFTEGWVLGAKATATLADGRTQDISDSVTWTGDASFNPPKGKQTMPAFTRASRLDDGSRKVTITVEFQGDKATATQSFETVNPRKGYARVGDTVFAPAVGGGSPAGPFSVTGKIVTGSPTILIGGVSAARVGDNGIHCCSDGSNTFEILNGDTQVLIDGKAAARKGDKTLHDKGTGSGTIISVASEALP